MGCSGCGKKNAARSNSNIMEQHKYLNDRQLRARLEVYKRQYCQNCEKKATCDYENYVKCKKNK